ncbi:MAG: type II toxin-antitoxin system VapC family toxin [Dehalococcoidia bacterium]|nr:type II toxin-antitoxin system VapC family toxin [Dehalococcoidia bacterium]
MVEEVVVDASVLVASFLDYEDKHVEALEYIRLLEAGDYLFHLPRLALVETLAAVNRRAQRRSPIYVLRAKAYFEQWQAEGKIAFYDMEESRARRAVDVALRDRLRGADAVYAALAEELGLELKTFDQEQSQRFQGRVSS